MGVPTIFVMFKGSRPRMVSMAQRIQQSLVVFVGCAQREKQFWPRFSITACKLPFAQVAFTVFTLLVTFQAHVPFGSLQSPSFGVEYQSPPNTDTWLFQRDH